MSVTIYARAERPARLTEDERRDLAALARSWSVADDCAAFQRTARGWNGEDLLVGEVAPPVVFKVGAKLPSEDDFWVGVSHWCDAFTVMRRRLRDARWTVWTDDARIAWDKRREQLVPEIPIEELPRIGNYHHWRAATAGKLASVPAPYAATATYRAGDLLEHPRFGIGVALRAVDPTKVEMRFRDAVRILAHRLAKPLTV